MTDINVPAIPDIPDVNTTSIVNEMQGYIEQVRTNTKYDLKDKIKLATMLVDRQLKAGALNLGYQRAQARLPEGSEKNVPHLNAMPAQLATNGKGPTQ